MWDPFTKYVRTETTRIFIFIAVGQNNKQNKLQHFRQFQKN